MSNDDTFIRRIGSSTFAWCERVMVGFTPMTRVIVYLDGYRTVGAALADLPGRIADEQRQAAECRSQGLEREAAACDVEARRLTRKLDHLTALVEYRQRIAREAADGA